MNRVADFSLISTSRVGFASKKKSFFAKYCGLHYLGWNLVEFEKSKIPMYGGAFLNLNSTGLKKFVLYPEWVPTSFFQPN
jgi:hypothetical protein